MHFPDSVVNISYQKCSSDTSQSYWIALPPDWDSIQRRPLIIAFDPHGNGKLAVQSLIGAATDFGYLVAGSNVIRNGYDKMENAFAALTGDILNRYQVNKDRIYTVGFSGGGRFAQIFSQMNPDIKAVISIGAGSVFNQSGAPGNKLPLLFLVGDEDFNYMEIINSYKNLELLGFKSYVFEFHGKHEWPERQIMDEALLWFEFDDCRRNKTRKNDPLIRDYLEIINEKAGRLMADQDNMQACEEYEKGIAFLAELVNTKSMAKKLKLCRESPGYKDNLDKKQYALNLETRLQQGYISALNQKDTLWWRNEIRRLDQELNDENDPYLLSAYNRVKSFISMAAYSYCNSSLRENDLDRAARLIAIYRTVDPSNPDGYYFSALYYSRSGQQRQGKRVFQESYRLWIH